MTSPKFRLGNRRPYGYLRSPTLLRLRGCVRGVSIGLEAGTAGHSHLRQGGVQLGIAIVVEIEYCFDLPEVMKSMPVFYFSTIWGMLRAQMF